MPLSNDLTTFMEATTSADQANWIAAIENEMRSMGLGRVTS